MQGLMIKNRGNKLSKNKRAGLTCNLEPVFVHECHVLPALRGRKHQLQLVVPNCQTLHTHIVDYIFEMIMNACMYDVPYAYTNFFKGNN